MTIHALKTWPIYFGVSLSGHKSFEVRKNDRDFKAGDGLILKEYHPQNGYTGREIRATVCYVFTGVFLEEDIKGVTGISIIPPGSGLCPGYCVLGLQKMPPSFRFQSEINEQEHNSVISREFV